MICKKIQGKNNLIFIKSLIGILFGLIWGIFMFWLFCEDEKSELIEKNDLEVVSGILSNYKYYGQGFRSVSHYRISLDGQGTYILLSDSIDEFDWKHFEQVTEIGENIILYVDKNAKGAVVKDGEIYEIWSDNVCYFSYEEYIKAYKESQNESKIIKWGFLLFGVFMGIIVAINIWREETTKKSQQ